MVQCFGKSFTDTLPERLASYAVKWKLSNFNLIEYYSVNCLFLCQSEKYGDCVLKIFGCDYEWYIDEIRALDEIDGKCGYVRAHEHNEEEGVLLLERICPGTTLKLEPLLERRLTTFVSVWQSAHMVPHDILLYRTYLKTTEDAAMKQVEGGENPALKRTALLMASVCRDLYSRYTARVLLHADLHGDNLLKDAHGEYRIVDPHARIGPPICDLGRYIANEYGDAKEGERTVVTEAVIAWLSNTLKLPKIDIARAFFVDITLMTCWDAEDGAADLSGVLYAETLLS